MKSINDLREFYLKSLRPDLQVLEGKRKEIIRKIGFFAFPSLVIVIGFFIFLLLREEELTLVFIPLVFFLIVNAIAYHFLTRQLEDPEFEKHFAVYGNDQVQSRYILSTSLMKRIMDFKKKTGKDIYLSFLGTKVYIAVRFTKNLFEPKLFKTLLNFEIVREYFDDFMITYGIVEDLNLNTRIWSKG